MRLTNFTVLKNKIIFNESRSKTFYGGLKDLKYTPQVVTHFCHEINVENHSRCLVLLYKLYIEKVQGFAELNAFYFRPNRNSSIFGYEKCPIGINSLNSILPNELCAKAGLKRKPAHSLRITCASKLFQSGVEEKLIRQRTGHRSDALLRYEHPSVTQLSKASSVLGPSSCS